MENFLQVTLLGIIEGITEFLPISSTGHLLIAQHLGLGQRSELFSVVIQAGAILAVTLIYWQRIWSLLTGWRQAENRLYLFKLFAAFMVTVVLGVLIKKLGIGLPDTIQPVAWALLIGGFWILLAEWLAAKKPPHSEITWPVALLTGFAQIIAAVFPGTSRSGACIFTAMLSGTNNRAAATEFVFLLGIPTMYAASAKKIIDAAQEGTLAAENWGDVTWGFVVSLITAFIAVKWLLHYIQSHTFNLFAYYRIALGIILLLFFSHI